MEDGDINIEKQEATEKQEEVEEKQEAVEEQEEVEAVTENTFFVYLLRAIDGSSKTYIGATVNLARRLRQHNRELVGGASATWGHTWMRSAHVSGFPSWGAALQFEWRWKQLSRKVGIRDPLRRRAGALHTLLALDRSTTKAIPFCDWPIACQVHVECPLFEQAFGIHTEPRPIPLFSKNEIIHSK